MAMLRNCTLVFLLGFFTWDHVVSTANDARFNMSMVPYGFANPNQYTDSDVLHCPLSDNEFVVCPGKHTDSVCICNHNSNMKIYKRHQCLKPLTAYENVHSPKIEIIYLRIKHQKITSIKNELLPELEKPFEVLNVNKTEHHIVYLQCTQDPVELIVAYEVLRNAANFNEWTQRFNLTFGETGKIEIRDIHFFQHYYSFKRFLAKINTEGPPSANRFSHMALLSIAIVFIVATLLTAGYLVSKRPHKCRSIPRRSNEATVSFRAERHNLFKQI